jgi:predicted lipid-binding transport protein (Tim44 family)
LKMKKRKSLYFPVVMAIILFFGLLTLVESSAWARAGAGGSYGSRGSRSYSAPSTPSSPSPSRPYSGPGSVPGAGSYPGAGNRPSSGWFSGSPFLQGLAGGVAGGFLGNMLFGGGGGHAAGGMGGYGGGGIGLFDIIILGLLLYFGYKFYKRWRLQKEGTSFYGDVVSPRIESPYGTTRDGSLGTSQDSFAAYGDDLERGLDQIRRIDPNFNEESFKELVQDLFFRIQAGWMNRSLEGIDNLLTAEMSEFFKNEFEAMKQKGRINRLENIAVRKVEISEAWQETGKDYVTVFFTANLLDYTVDDKTGQVVEGDKLNPVKFQEFWTFCRDIGSSRWQLSAINQVGEPVTRH